MSSVINGGYYYQPHLVKEIQDSNGSTVKTVEPVLLKQTISSEISAAIRSYMEDSVIEGTSRHSKVQGYSSGGKTGTAENSPVETKVSGFLYYLCPGRRTAGDRICGC